MDVRTGPFACNPLDPDETPTALRHVIGIGRDKDGTIYVLDDDMTYGHYRLFQSQGQTLQLLQGSAGTSSPTHVEFNATASTGPLELEVEADGDVATAMGIASGPLPDKDFTIGSAGDVLDLLGQDAIASLAVRGLGYRVLYNATTPDGHRLVALEPTNGAEADLDYRVFYGTDDNMTERRLVRFASGSIMGFDFTVDGTEYGATFVEPDIAASMPDIVNNLKVGGPPAFNGGLALTLHSATGAASLKFICTQ